MRKLSLLLLVLSMSGQVFGHGTNRVPDSSFECGLARGWNAYMTGNDSYQGNQCWQTGLLTNIALHGRYSMCVLPESRLLSRAVMLSNSWWCLSYYARTASGSGGGQFRAGVVSGTQLGTLATNVQFVQNGNMSGTWTRYSTNILITSNTFYWVQFYHTQPTVLIDGIQLEPGTSPTTYAPHSTIEMGIKMNGTYSMFFAGETPSFGMEFWNDGIATNARAYYQVFDTWNSNVVSMATNIAVAAATNTSVTINLSSRKGWFRPVTRLLDYDDSWDEAKLVVYPYASNVVGHATNDWLGGHPQGRTWMAQRESMAARRFGRLLSPNFRNTRWDNFEATQGNFTFFPQDISNMVTSGMIVIAPITPTDELWPTWATNADGSANLMAWSNACYRCVLFHKTYMTNTYYEIGPNEPHQSGPYGLPASADAQNGENYTGTNKPINVRVATNYVKTLSYGIAGATNADPAVKIIGIAGSDGEATWAWEVWTNLSANIQGWITAVSTHQYPQDRTIDPNDPFLSGLTASFNNPAPWITKFGGIKPVWNTESAEYAVGLHQTLNGLWPTTYDPMTNLVAAGVVDESRRSEQQSRQLVSLQRILPLALRCKGYGFDKYIYYDSRQFNESSFAGTQPYAADYQQVDRPEIVSLSIATHFVRWGFGAISNAQVELEMYAFTNATGQAVVAAWDAGRTNRNVTLSNAVSQFDCMGNFVANSTLVRTTRLPHYFTNGSLTLAQLSNTFKFSTNIGVVDTLAPRLSFDIAPSGLWSGDTNKQLIKWTGLDDTWTAWPSNSVASKSGTNVVFKWKLNGGSYNGYSQSNHVWLDNIPAGTNTFWVTTSDRNGNAAEYGHSFSSSAEAEGGGGGGTTNTINVGTLNIGTITVVP